MQDENKRMSGASPNMTRSSNSTEIPHAIEVYGARVHNLKNINVKIPLNKITAIAGVSGSGKTSLILESLILALKAKIAGEKLPAHIKKIEADGIKQIKLIDATPIEINVRSTVATYANVHDELRKVFARRRYSLHGLQRLTIFKRSRTDF